jgi:hypothetical protein
MVTQLNIGILSLLWTNLSKLTKIEAILKRSVFVVLVERMMAAILLP